MPLLLFVGRVVQCGDVNIFKFRFESSVALLTQLVPFEIFVAPLQH